MHATSRWPRANAIVRVRSGWHASKANATLPVVRHLHPASPKHPYCLAVLRMHWHAHWPKPKHVTYEHAHQAACGAWQQTHRK